MEVFHAFILLLCFSHFSFVGAQTYRCAYYGSSNSVEEALTDPPAGSTVLVYPNLDCGSVPVTPWPYTSQTVSTCAVQSCTIPSGCTQIPWTLAISSEYSGYRITSDSVTVQSGCSNYVTGLELGPFSSPARGYSTWLSCIIFEVRGSQVVIDGLAMDNTECANSITALQTDNLQNPPPVIAIFGPTIDDVTISNNVIVGTGNSILVSSSPTTVCTTPNSCNEQSEFPLCGSVSVPTVTDLTIDNNQFTGGGLGYVNVYASDTSTSLTLYGSLSITVFAFLYLPYPFAPTIATAPWIGGVNFVNGSLFLPNSSYCYTSVPGANTLGGGGDWMNMFMSLFCIALAIVALIIFLTGMIIRWHSHYREMNVQDSVKSNTNGDAKPPGSGFRHLKDEEDAVVNHNPHSAVNSKPSHVRQTSIDEETRLDRRTLPIKNRVIDRTHADDDIRLTKH